MAQIAPLPMQRRNVQWGSMRDRVKLLPGWDDPIDLDRVVGETATGQTLARNAPCYGA